MFHCRLIWSCTKSKPPVWRDQPELNHSNHFLIILSNHLRDSSKKAEFAEFAEFAKLAEFAEFADQLYSVAKSLYCYLANFCSSNSVYLPEWNRSKQWLSCWVSWVSWVSWVCWATIQRCKIRLLLFGEFLFFKHCLSAWMNEIDQNRDYLYDFNDIKFNWKCLESCRGATDQRIGRLRSWSIQRSHQFRNSFFLLHFVPFVYLCCRTDRPNSNKNSTADAFNRPKYTSQSFIMTKYNILNIFLCIFVEKNIDKIDKINS